VKEFEDITTFETALRANQVACSVVQGLDLSEHAQQLREVRVTAWSWSRRASVSSRLQGLPFPVASQCR